MKPAARAVKPAAKEVRRVVAALIVRRGKVLICQRTRHQAMPLKWEFPGGKIEAGESPQAALERELDEELGITPRVGREVAQITHRYRSGVAVKLQFFLVEKFQGELDNRIFADIVWAGPRTIADYDFLEADAPLVRDIAAGKIL
jgi:8-oxo-dGTP diphosphatase